MNDPLRDESEKPIPIDLLSGPNARPRWMPLRGRDPYAWRILSGTWKFPSPHTVVYQHDADIKNGENISLVGLRHWHDFDLEIKFRFLTDSRRPPEGGAIVYLRFQNIRNYYSFHFCLPKQKIEFVKRHRGDWNIVAAQKYELAEKKVYSLEFTTRAAIHECRIDKVSILAVEDHDFSMGRVGIGVKYCDLEFRQVSISLDSDDRGRLAPQEE
jgi:hypothetical protein